MTREEIENYLLENAGDVENEIRDYDIQDIMYGYSEREDIIKRLDILIASYVRKK